MKHRLIAAAATLALLAIACGSSTATAQSIETVLPARAAEIIADDPSRLVVLDVRTPAEFAEGHLAGAILVDYNAPSFRSEVDRLDKDVPYVMYCRSGNRSAGAREIMRELGFGEVYEIDGGIVNWVAAGLPVASG